MSLTTTQFKEVQKIRKYLIDYIFKRSDFKQYYTTYNQLVVDCKLPYNNLQRNPQHRHQLGVVLADLLERELNERRPPLTSIIYGVGLYRPRDGFYKTLKNLGYRNTKTMNLEDMREINFRRKFEKETVDFWRKEVNYLQFK